MTNFLSTAQLTPGAACWKALLEIESEMSHAYIEAMEASKNLMKAQPLFTQATLGSYKAQANNQLISGSIGGGSEIAAGLTQFGLSYKGDLEGDKAFKETMEPDTLRVTAENVTPPAPRTSTTPNSTAAATVEGRNEAPTTQTDETRTSERSAIQTREEGQNSTSTREDADEKAKTKAEKQKKLGEQRRQGVVQKYQNYVQLSGAVLRGLGTTASTPFNSQATQNAGLAQAVGNVTQGNQTAQNSYNTLTQTYKDAFTNAAQVLAGVVAAQSH
ncbi:MAG TPA: hypothetical protein VFU89_06755 [Rhabdochlamydiaceae bacterium]|nr:hypothetical protein [Rhabdochlamydiaceae bacterium]